MVFRHVGLAVSLLLLSACAGVESYRDPIRVTVSGIQVLESTLLEQLYLVTLRIQNHNEEPIAITGGSFDLEINGKDFGSGVTDQAVTVPAYADAKVEVRMVSTVFGMLRLDPGHARAYRSDAAVRDLGQVVGEGHSGRPAFPRGRRDFAARPSPERLVE